MRQTGVATVKTDLAEMTGTSVKMGIMPQITESAAKISRAEKICSRREMQRHIIQLSPIQSWLLSKPEAKADVIKQKRQMSATKTVKSLMVFILFVIIRYLLSVMIWRNTPYISITQQFLRVNNKLLPQMR